MSDSPARSGPTAPAPAPVVGRNVSYQEQLRRRFADDQPPHILGVDQDILAAAQVLEVNALRQRDHKLQPTDDSVER